MFLMFLETNSASQGYLTWNLADFNKQSIQNTMMTSSNGKITALYDLCEGNPLVAGGFPSQRPMTRSFDAFFDLHPSKRSSKQSGLWWFERPSPELWRHCNDETLGCMYIKTVYSDSLDRFRFIITHIFRLLHWHWDNSNAVSFCVK